MQANTAKTANSARCKTVAALAALTPERNLQYAEGGEFMSERIGDIKIGDRLRKDLQDLKQLTESIRAVGLMHPVVIDFDRNLIAGHRRLEACKSLGWSDIPALVVDMDDALRGQVDENVARADFLPSETVAIRGALLESEREKSRNRMFSGVSEDPVETLHRVADKKRSPSTDDRIASVAGVSRPTLIKATEGVEAAKAEPDKFASLVEEMDRTGRVHGVHRKLQVAKQAEELNAEPKPLPEGPYRVIVVDPPWQYDKRAKDPSHQGATPYVVMGQSDLLNVPIGDMAHDDSILWLWATNAFVGDALELVRAWGFTQKTILTWVKNRMGTGDWLRGKTEHCILAVRGRPTVRLTNQTTALIAPAGRHSEKPQEFYEMVDWLCPGSKIDVFARREREGWATYGLEVE